MDVILRHSLEALTDIDVLFVGSEASQRRSDGSVMVFS
jgi:hypothetical protein